MANGYKTGGRTKGTPNKIPAAVREMILTALSNKGGVEYFEHIAETQPVAFCSLIGKILPTQVEGSDEYPFELCVVVGGDRDHQQNG